MKENYNETSDTSQMLNNRSARRQTTCENLIKAYNLRPNPSKPCFGFALQYLHDGLNRFQVICDTPERGSGRNQTIWHLNVCVLMTCPPWDKYCIIASLSSQLCVLIEESSLAPRRIKQQFSLGRKTAGAGTRTHYAFGLSSSTAKGLREFLQGVGKEKNTS